MVAAGRKISINRVAAVNSGILDGSGISYKTEITSFTGSLVVVKTKEID